MTIRLALLVLIGIWAWAARQFAPWLAVPGGQATTAMGLLLLGAYVLGDIAARWRLPRITGAIAAGLFMGPSILGLATGQELQDLQFINDLALAYIALHAGGQLTLDTFRRRWRSLLSLSSSVTVPVAAVGTVAFLAMARWLPFTAGFSSPQLLAIGLLFGVILSSQSPSATVAVIEETGAHGPYSEVSLAVIVTLDSAVILAFAAATSIADAMLTPGTAFDPTLLLIVLLEIGLSFLIGGGMGFGLVYLLRWRSLNPAVVLLWVGFLVARLSREVTSLLTRAGGLQLHLEPLLICVVIGFVLGNVPRRTQDVHPALDLVSMTMFALFFALAGAALDLRMLAQTWPLVLATVVLRIGMLLVAGRGGGWLSGELRPLWGLYWRAFVAQAGVSLGLTMEIGRRFPTWGPAFRTLMLGVITVNQILGPILFHGGLNLAGEIAAGRRPPPR